MELTFPFWELFLNLMVAGGGGGLQGGIWVGWTLAEPQETRKRRGEGSWWPVSPQLSSTQFYPSPPSQLHFNPEGSGVLGTGQAGGP